MSTAGYRVGLSVTLVKQLVQGPARRQLIHAIPDGFNAQSRKNAENPSDYPLSLELLERLGMLLGPRAYLAKLGQSAVPRH